MTKDTPEKKDLFEFIQWSEQGLIPAVAQDAESGRLLMLAWMNEESLRLTIEEGIAIYWSRSRQKLWRKGESSGNVQQVKEIRIDCDEDTVLLAVNQVNGIACHTGRESCFYKVLKNNQWETVDPIIKSSSEMYGENHHHD